MNRRKSVWEFAGIVVLGTALAAGSGLFSLAAQQTRVSLPRVVQGSAPFYPRIAVSARIEGIVLLRVSTDGKHVSDVDIESGPALLAKVSSENVRTWEFEPHSPTSFEVRFRYKISRAFTCEGGCGNCRHLENESVLLELPADVELNANSPISCDPSVTRKEKK